MISVLGIAGSPRKKGNSTILMKRVLDGAEAKGARSDMVYLHDLSFKGCQACLKCSPGGHCVIKDGLSPVFSALRLADVWVLAAPIYFDGLSGQLKMFFDRLRHFFYEDGERKIMLKGKRRGLFIITYADDENEHYLKVVKETGKYLNWMGEFGEVEYLIGSELYHPEDLKKKPGLLEQAKKLGEKLVQF